MKSELTILRQRINAAWLADEDQTVRNLCTVVDLDSAARKQIEQRAAELVNEMRRADQPGVMETFLAEYGLSTREGIALMCMAEALLRVPDALTIDALIQDKIAPANWSQHLGHSGSPLVNASTWALLLTGKVIRPEDASSLDLLGTLRKMIKRVGDPVIRSAVAQSMRVLGHQFVLGRNVGEAVQRAAAWQDKGYCYSYDMLGEAAHTAADARRYFIAYSSAITALAAHCHADDVRDNPGISVKLSALHPRYEFNQREHCVPELVSRVSSLALLAKNAGMGFNIDAEEAHRLDLSLDIIEQVLADPDLQGWSGFGVVVQSYMPRALHVIDWLHALAVGLDRKIMVRLVKGAYWDSEIKQAQEQGLKGYPVFTRKTNTDLSYLACARRLFQYSQRIYPQFATHNAHSVASVVEMAGSFEDFEFQRLHGMGELLYELLRKRTPKRCRIYAPVGIHEDLLAYLVRRLLENGANSSFVNRVLDETVPAQTLVRDPVATIAAMKTIANPRIPTPAQLFEPQRRNSNGFNLADPLTLADVLRARNKFQKYSWSAAPLIQGQAHSGQARAVTNPANRSDTVGEVIEASPEQCRQALNVAVAAVADWQNAGVQKRAECLLKIADLYELHAPELIALATREAGKSLADGVSEVREAVDFCRYYAAQAMGLFTAAQTCGRGVFVCISPWNFPLAIFSGQIVAALVTGNSVIAKPAEQSPLIAARAVGLMHEAGIPVDVLQLLPGDGPVVGAALVSDERVGGVCFTGSTQAAQAINRAMAQVGNPYAPLIAETGGLNAMIVDSSALPEQAVRDIVTSAFQSAGQRCSALRVLCLQVDIADHLLAMLKGAMAELKVGDPWELDTDVGPVIDNEAKTDIERHCESLQACQIMQLQIPQHLYEKGSFVAPAAYALSGIDQLEREIFGPVLHVVRYRAADLDALVDTINARGFGLTLGIHTRVDRRVQSISERAEVGNVYVNRNQIGAVVGAQPFGGEGLSGTGPKAGGPYYLRRFIINGAHNGAQKMQRTDADAKQQLVGGSHNNLSALLSGTRKYQRAWSGNAQRTVILAEAGKYCSKPISDQINRALSQLPVFPVEAIDLPGPTGESNRLSVTGRGVFLWLADIKDDYCGFSLASAALLAGDGLVIVASKSQSGAVPEFIEALQQAGVDPGLVQLCQGPVSLQALRESEGLAGVLVAEETCGLRQIRQALADRQGPIVPLVYQLMDFAPLCIERSLCIDTTASGGNAQLLASAGSAD